MTHPELKALTRAEQLFNDGKLDDALDIFNDKSQYERINFQQKEYFQFLKGLILFYQNKGEELIELGEQIFNEGQKLNENLQSFDGLYFILIGLCITNKFEEALSKIEKAEVLLGLISNVPKNIIFQREARISVLKAFISYYTSNIELAEKCLEGPLASEKELGNTFEIVWANIIMLNIMIQIRKRSDVAMEYAKKAMSLAKEIKFNHYWIGLCYIGLGVIHSCICEYDLSFKQYRESLTIYKEINNKWFIAILLNNIGNLYCEKGEYELALKYLEESLILWEPYPFLLEACLDNLIFVSFEKGDTERAQKYFQRLEIMYNQKKNDRPLELHYQYNKALMLKRSSRIRDIAKSEEILKKVIETENIYYDFIIYAYIHLCDLLLTEFRIINSSEALDELNHNIAKLLTIAEKTRSYLVFCETFILQAKLALTNFDVKTARRFLTQAQKIAESHGIKRLAMKISHEHDELLRHIKMWENLKESDAPLSERWKLAGLNEQMENMVKKRMITVPEYSDEEPVLLLIISKGGIPFFSQSFIEDKSFESHLFGGFLSTIDYFMKEMFSEGLDRAVFGEHTLLMKAIPPFFISYIFKGDSYYALQKVDYFTDHLQKENEIWQNLLKSFQTNKTIQLKDDPLLESLITEIFITKTIVFSEF
ncbi:MAG: tetratricopeptide repeat protein [Promethearchaeota archaeon]